MIRVRTPVWEHKVEGRKRFDKERRVRTPVLEVFAVMSIFRGQQRVRRALHLEEDEPVAAQAEAQREEDVHEQSPEEQ